MSTRFLRVCLLTVAVAAVAGGCGSSKSSSSTSSAAASATSSTSTSSGGTATPGISVTSFTSDFSAMNSLKSLTAAGKGKVAAILPDTTSSTRYVEFDAPYLKQAAAAAGLPSGDMTVENALGSDSTFVTDAESAITNGATVLLIDPEDSGTGVTVQRYAKAHGVAVVDYDRLTLGAPAGTADYVSFNNVHVGQLIGSGFVQCVNAVACVQAERRRDARRRRPTTTPRCLPRATTGSSRPTSRPGSTCSSPAPRERGCRLSR